MPGPRDAKGVKYEGVSDGQRGGIDDDFVGINDRCVERDTPRLVANDTVAMLTRGLGTVAVAVEPRFGSFVRHTVIL
jgi:hypothetical protein